MLLWHLANLLENLLKHNYKTSTAKLEYVPCIMTAIWYIIYDYTRVVYQLFWSDHSSYFSVFSCFIKWYISLVWWWIIHHITIVQQDAYSSQLQFKIRINTFYFYENIPKEFVPAICLNFLWFTHSWMAENYIMSWLTYYEPMKYVWFNVSEFIPCSVWYVPHVLMVDL